MIVTHTFVVLQISDAAFAEINEALTKAKRTDCFHRDNGEVVIDMNGIALANSRWSPYARDGREDSPVTSQ